MAIGIGVLFGFVFTIGHIANGLTDDSFRVLLQLLHGRLERCHAVFLSCAFQLLLRSLERADMGLGIALYIKRRAGVVHDDGEQILAHLAGLVEFQRRQAQTFTGNMGACKSLAAGRTTAKIHPMSTTDTKREDLAIEEDRTQEGHVVDVRAALVRIVQHVNIARLHGRQRILLDNRLGAELHRRQMDRTIGSLRQQLALIVINCVGEIDHIRQDRRKRSALEHGRHTFTGVFKHAAQDFEGDWIDLVLIDNRGIDLYFYVHRMLLGSLQRQLS